MSGKTVVRGFTLLVALAVSACATTTPNEPPTAQSLLDSMYAPTAPSLKSCSALNMALVCQSAILGRTSSRAQDERCACADRNELMDGSMR